MRLGIRAYVGRRHCAKRVVGPRGGAHREQEPCTLHIGQEWQMLQQSWFLGKALLDPRRDEVRVPNPGAVFTLEDLTASALTADKP